MIRVTAALVLLAAVSLPALGACNGSCDEVGCQNALTIRVRESSGTLTPGEYAVEVVTATATISASCTVSADPATTPTCSDAFPVLGDSGVLAILVHVEGTPKTGSVSVFRDNALLTTTSVSPTYRDEFPNGENCPPRCSIADSTVTVD